MPSLLLDAVEARILGCLLEKERLTPENYPISLNSLVAASNQSTNREPVVGFDERTVEAGLYSLREKKLASLIHAAGARVQKYRHNLPDLYELTPGETALPEWHDFYADDKLREVIVETLNNNRDLRVAALNIEAARAQYHVQRSQSLPGSILVFKSRCAASRAGACYPRGACRHLWC